tara:strand:+ start:298 stop:561 length:264 start_codon:yes stop_codon:yes gene_type:complete
MSEYKINGKPVEQYWTELTAKHLVGKKIVKVEYFPEVMMEDVMWHKRPITIHLEDGTILLPQMDDEGNDGGAIATNIKELETIPVIS